MPADVYVAAFRGSSDLLAVVRLSDRTVVDVNDAFLGAFGYRREEVIGRTTSDLGLVVDPEAREGFYARLEDEGGVASWESRLRTRRGDVRILRSSATVVEHGRDRYAFVAARDVTRLVELEEELREAEARYRGIFERAQEGLFRTALDGTLLEANPALARIAGYGSVEELLREAPNVEVFYQDLGQRRELIRAVAERGSVEGIELRMRRPRDGREVWISVSATAIRDEQGRLVGLEGSVVDVTDRVRYERHRSELAAEIVRVLEAERAAIAAGIHDDPIQKMTAVLLRLGALRQRLEGSDEALRKLEEDVRTAIDRLRHLIFDLHPAVLEREGLAAALRELIASMREDWGIRVELRDRLHVEPPPEVGILAYRVAKEALVNARKHARAGRVGVTLEDVDGGLRVVVEDDGVGFDPGAAARPRPGHLGLEAMRERVRLAGGRWEVHSRSGEGTRVEFVIPFSAGDATGPAAR
ncbi:MAG TPA: PAS domain S-box protein [Actinomycetota bacterium]|nr:PAS domain S-box protein [Actinomycetota bacterium]